MAKRPGPPNTFETGPVRLRQVALVARDLQKAKELLTTVLGTEVVYVDPAVGQWGLENFLVAVGGELIEVVSPKQPGTTAGRLLEKRGDGGYMIIMQHPDAQYRREFIEKRKLAKVIYSNKSEDSVTVQYHPKGIKGGVIPELDSQSASKETPNPLNERISAWHACGPDVASYTAAMKRSEHLSLAGVTCRLAPGDHGGELAATQWEQIFGIPRSRDLNAFTNARLGFIAGQEGQPEGIVSISIGVKGEKRRDAILQRAENLGLLRNEKSGRFVEMFGIRWNFTLTSLDEGSQSKL